MSVTAYGIWQNSYNSYTISDRKAAKRASHRGRYGPCDPISDNEPHELTYVDIEAFLATF